MPSITQEVQSHSSNASFANSSLPTIDGFTPEIPAHLIKSTQNGEFIDLSKVLTKNLLGFETAEESFQLSLGENSTLKLSKSTAPKKKIVSIQDWTTAFTLYMKIIVEKFPGRAQELISYLELIRYAAAYH